MTVTNSESGTNVHEVAPGIYRINTPVPSNVVPGGFSFNQYLIEDEASLLFHTGTRRMFPAVVEAVRRWDIVRSEVDLQVGSKSSPASRVPTPRRERRPQSERAAAAGASSGLGPQCRGAQCIAAPLA